MDAEIDYIHRKIRSKTARKNDEPAYCEWNEDSPVHQAPLKGD